MHCLQADIPRTRRTRISIGILPRELTDVELELLSGEVRKLTTAFLCPRHTTSKSKTMLRFVQIRQLGNGSYDFHVVPCSIMLSAQLSQDYTRVFSTVL